MDAAMLLFCKGERLLFVIVEMCLFYLSGIIAAVGIVAYRKGWLA